MTEELKIPNAAAALEELENRRRERVLGAYEETVRLFLPAFARWRDAQWQELNGARPIVFSVPKETLDRCLQRFAQAMHDEGWEVQSEANGERCTLTVTPARTPDLVTDPSPDVLVGRGRG